LFVGYYALMKFIIHLARTSYVVLKLIPWIHYQIQNLSLV